MRTTVPEAHGTSLGNLIIPFSMTAVMLMEENLAYQPTLVEGGKITPIQSDISFIRNYARWEQLEAIKTADPRFFRTSWRPTFAPVTFTPCKNSFLEPDLQHERDHF